ncbi:gliding motility protein GldM [Mucilaginibacter sp. McL0603]|uniref:type IX secretion system motor protein PorM/GldM n=1 Tax=Mucilaginibacter sp. McL0603 TaxID=3415670 RepID=UPI003CF240B9
MAGGKETPRQRMIGILYLVLLGLIALEVPENLLDSFKNISDSLTASKKNVQVGIDNTFTAFEKTKLVEQKERAAPIYEKAKKAKELANSLDAYIESLKTQMVSESGGMSEATGDYAGREGMDFSVDLMVDRRKNGYELHKKIDATREQLLALLDPKDRVGVNLALQAVAPKPRNGFPTKDWEQANFGEGIPMGAAMTALIKIQSDVKNSENEVVKKILGKVDQAVVNLDKFNAVAVAPTSYVLVGQPYTAQVFLTASDSHSNPTITVDGSKLTTDGGVGKYSGSTGSEGIHTWVGTIQVRQNDGTFKEYKTPPQTYQVARPSAVVSPDKMNVLFIGVANPVSVSAPGVPKEKLHVSISTGSLSGSAGKYEATVNGTGDATVTVSGDMNGKTQVLGSTLFRIKRIPDPKAQFAGKSSGNTSAANLKAQDRLFAKLENFYFDIKFDVVRFTMVVMRPRQDAVILNSSSSELTPAMKQALSTISPGSKVIFGNIMATGPGGQRGLDDIILSAN